MPLLKVIFADTGDPLQTLPVPPEATWSMWSSINPDDLLIDDFNMDGYPDIAFIFTRGHHTWSAMAWLYDPATHQFQFSSRLFRILEEVTGYEVNATNRTLETVAGDESITTATIYSAVPGFPLLRNEPWPPNAQP